MLLTCLRWRAGAHDYDLAHLASTLHQTAEGNFLGSTYLGGSILSHHLYLTHLLYLPLLEIFETAFVLQLGQVLSLLAAAWFLGRYAARRFADEALGWTVALAFVLHPAFTGLALSDYDPASLGVLFLAAALAAEAAGRAGTAWVLLLLSFGAKEILPLGGLSYGAAVCAFVRRGRRRGFVIAATAFFVLAAWSLLKPPMHPPYDAEYYFCQRFGWWREGGGVDWALLTRTVSAPGKLAYPFELLAPLAFLPLGAPAALAFALPEAGINYLATFFMTGLAVHYHFATLPALTVGAAEAVARLRRGGREAPYRARAALLAASLAAALVAANSPFSASLRYARSLPPPDAARRFRAEVEAVREALPEEGRVAVFGRWRLLPRLYDRHVATPVAYSSRTRDRLEKYEVLIYDGETPPEGLLRTRPLLLRRGGVTVLGPPSERRGAR